AAQANFPIVKHTRLARRDRTLCQIETHDVAVAIALDDTGLIALAVTRLGGDARRQGGRLAADPVHLRQQQRIFKQARMLRALRNDQYIARQILLDHIPGRIASAVDAADAQSLTLADGVVHQAVVLADAVAVDFLDHAGLRRQITLQAILETAFADKTDPGRILFVVRDQIVFSRNVAHLWLG